MNGPTTEKQRYVVLDALRGLALLGIALANFPEFGLWTFLSSEAQEAMPTANADHVTRFLQYLFVDGKFYTIFSILFGIGFGLGTCCGLITIEGIATLVFLLEVVLCRLWLSYFRFGPLEWIWRLLTYGEWIRLRK